MAKIDTLIDLMVKRQADEVLLVADQPSSALVSGQYRAWPAISRVQLETVIAEILPPEFARAVNSDLPINFPYQSRTGTFNITVEIGTLQGEPPTTLKITPPGYAVRALQINDIIDRLQQVDTAAGDPTPRPPSLPSPLKMELHDGQTIANPGEENAVWQDVRPARPQSQPAQPASKFDTLPVTIRYNLREPGVEADSAGFTAALERLDTGEAAFFYVWRSHCHPSLIVSASALSEQSFDIHCLGYGGRENKVYMGKENLTQAEAVTIFETFSQGNIKNIDWQPGSLAKQANLRLGQLKRRLARQVARRIARQKARQKARQNARDHVREHALLSGRLT